MLFPDRLEVLNPGSLPFGLTIEKLYRARKSIPANPLLAESLYLYGIIERMGTGTEDIVNACTEKGLMRPEFTQDSGFEAVIYRRSQVEYEAMHPTTQPTIASQSATTRLPSDWGAIATSGETVETSDSKRSQATAKRLSSDCQATVTINRKREIVIFIADKGKATSMQIATLTGLTQGRVRTILQQLVADGEIIKIGDNRYAYYVLKQQ